MLICTKAQAAIEYAITFVAFTLAAIFFWTIFIKSNPPGRPTVVEKYVERVKGEIN